MDHPLEQADGEGFPFGQTESITDRIRGLIREYPEGIGIIKELIQNADDAGARKLHVVVDWRNHSTDGLPDPRMEKLQGPALLAYNDAVFSRRDFEHIQKIGISGKIRTAAKTGRFGLGFNAVYNVTDWPGFVTGEPNGDERPAYEEPQSPRVSFFDPHCSAVFKATEQEPGYSWDLKFVRQKFPNLLKAFEAGSPLYPAGSEGESVELFGTIFRLPFRSEPSNISREVFGKKNIQDILDKLTTTGEEILLFLNSGFHD
jgi:sacsin